MTWDRRHLLDVDSFLRTDFEDIFYLTDKLLPYSGIGHLTETHGKPSLPDDRPHPKLQDDSDEWKRHPRKRSHLAAGAIMTLWFEHEYEKSTRTYGSFQGAMMRLGGSWKDFNEPESSMEKGESMEDTTRILSQHSDIIVDRHRDPEHVYRIADISQAHVINGGNGSYQHPTQTILDLYTIHKKRGVDDTTIAVVGDLMNGRTVHSLCRGLNVFSNVKVIGLYPEDCGLPDSFKPRLYEGREIDMEHLDRELDEIQPDVIYVTRPQRERSYACQSYQISRNTVDVLPSKCLIMHPLPRDSRNGPEIATEVDTDARAVYFEQAAYGVPTRMALISMMLGYERQIKCGFF